MSNQEPLVSVVIPCYNHERYVKDCIQSVIDQTYQNIELIIIDDGSKDNSVAKIQKMVDKCKDRFIRFEFINRENKGLTKSLNEALALIKGVYYIVIASDDLMVIDRISNQVDILEGNKQFYACSGSQLKIDMDGNILSKREQNNILYKNCVKSKDNIFKSSNNIYSPTTMFRTEIIKDIIGGYDETIQVEDLYIFYKSAMLGLKHLQVKNIFTYYRMHSENNHKRYIWMHENKMRILDVLEKSFNCSDLEKLVLLEGYYSLAKLSDKSMAKSLFTKCCKYFYSPYFIVGTYFLIFK